MDGVVHPGRTAAAGLPTEDGRTLTEPRVDTPKGPGARAQVQKFGTFLSNMVMPNIGAFIAWGLITSLFIKVGWINLAAGYDALADLGGLAGDSWVAQLGGWGSRMVNGEEVANTVADQLIYSSIRTDQDTQRLSIPTRIGVRHPKLASVIHRMEEHIEEPISPKWAKPCVPPTYQVGM